MYYGLDENGNLVSSGDSSVLPEEFQDLFPESASDLPGPSSNIFDELYSDSVSSGDLDSVSSGFISDSFNFITYDDLVEALALVPGYNVYPNTAAVNIFDGVFRSAGSSVDYLILSGSDTSSTVMYYAEDSSVTGKSITLKSPVTVCNYYSSRSGTTTYYYYTVGTTGDITFNVSNQLVYTNLLNGYPSLPSDQRGIGRNLGKSDMLSFVSIMLISVILVKLIIHRKKD